MSNVKCQMFVHKPVLLQEVLKIFNPRPGQRYIDATIDGGGHAEAIIEKIGPSGKLLGIDWDCELLEKLKFQVSGSRFQENIKLACDNYTNIKNIAGKYGFTKVDGILFDLGFSSYHLDKSGRGFSFRQDEPLDMRYNPKNNELTAEKIINQWPADAIEDILRKYGEERYSRRISRGIVRERALRKIATTARLLAVIQRSLPKAPRKTGIHPATRTFQALRIAVNNELENLRKGIQDSAPLLAKGGKIAVISFHSLEDRIVKQFLRVAERAGTLKTIASRPIIPSFQEIAQNPRARSAKLRAAERL